MPPLSRFALSKELPRLVSSAPKAFLDLARSLQKSGSDLVTEEDVVLVFGRNQLEPKFENSFKEVLRQSSQQTILSQALNIIIEGGPGPTVQRAMKHPAHFATVVQLSMLTWAHDKHSLASALSEAMRRRLQAEPPEEQVSPGEGLLYGVLKACEEQTSTFPWHLTFEAVHCKLGLQYPIHSDCNEEMYILTLTVPVLQACLDMLAATKSFPETRFMHIQCAKGVVTLVVWAHCLMGLNVSVRSTLGTVQFGEGKANVVIEFDAPGPKTCLLDASQEIILAVTGEDENTIDAEVKHPASGYGTMVLRQKSLSDGAISEMANLTAAMAYCISQRLVATGTDAGQSLDETKPTVPAPRARLKAPKRSDLLSDKRNLFTAGCFLFHGIDINPAEVQVYVPQLKERPLDGTLPIPPAVEVEVKRLPFEERKARWNHLMMTASELAALILALSNVSHLNECMQWRFGTLNAIRGSPLAQYLRNWNGKSYIAVHHDEWYDLLGRVMLGSKFAAPGHSCVISNWGWTMWMSTFADIDPHGVVPGMLTIRHGVPSRNGERRNRVVDGILDSQGGLPYRISEKSGETATARCTIDATVGVRMTGIRDDQFVVTVRFSINNSELLTGYFEMHRLRWKVNVLGECTHPPTTPVKLPTDTATVTGTDWTEPSNSPNAEETPRICASLTLGNRAARWMAMIAAEQSRNLILASNHICLSCSLHQASFAKGPLLIIC